jgi:sporulation protein YlmC with PRC-barrel domain
MRKINELYGKRVIDVSTGDPVAAVSDVVLSNDGRRIVALVTGGGGAFSSGEERVIRWDSVRSIGEYVVVDGTQPFAATGEDMEVAELRKDAHKITGKTVMSANGERIGTVGDMLFGESGDVLGYTIKQGGGLLPSSGDESLLRAEHIQAIGKDAIIATADALTALTDADLEADTPHARMVGTRAPLEDVPPAYSGPATVELPETRDPDARRRME